MGTSYSFALNDKTNVIKLISRTWEGVGRPDYDTVAEFSWKEAAALSQELRILSKTAKKNIHGKKLEELDAAREDLERARQRVKDLERETSE